MLYGSGKYTYEWVEDWAKLPKGVSFVDVCGIAIDNQDRIYVLNRSYQKPMMVFNRQGDLVASWGEGHFSQPQGARSVPDGFRYGDGYFSRAHGICIAPDGSIFCTNDRNHTVSKFTPDGGKLKIVAARDGDWCQVSVIDSGTGIKEEDLERIFEPFCQLENPLTKQTNGTGLGLALVRQIIEGYGGRIWVESEYGEGSRFTFTLPLATED